MERGRLWSHGRDNWGDSGSGYEMAGGDSLREHGDDSLRARGNSNSESHGDSNSESHVSSNSESHDSSNSESPDSDVSASHDRDTQRTHDRDISALAESISELKSILLDTREQTFFLQDQVDNLILENKLLSDKLSVFCEHQLNSPEVRNMHRNINDLVNINGNINNYMMEFINVVNKTVTWNTARNYITENPQELESLFRSKTSISQLQERAAISQNLARKVKLEPLNDAALISNVGDGLTPIQGDLNKIWSAYNKKGKSLDNIYTVSRSIRTVTELAEEYFEGINGSPSVLSLDLKFGNLWRKKDRSFYSKRMAIINKIKDLVERPSKYGIEPEFISKEDGTISLTLAIRIVENIRLGNNRESRANPAKPRELSLNGLYVYFRGKRDCREDYSVLLQGSPGKRR